MMSSGRLTCSSNTPAIESSRAPKMGGQEQTGIAAGHWFSVGQVCRQPQLVAGGGWGQTGTPGKRNSGNEQNHTNISNNKNNKYKTRVSFLP